VLATMAISVNRPDQLAFINFFTHGLASFGWDGIEDMGTS
jgi:hypothetical protein